MNLLNLFGLKCHVNFFHRMVMVGIILRWHAVWFKGYRFWLSDWFNWSYTTCLYICTKITQRLKTWHITAPGVSVISRYKPFQNSTSSDITSGRVHLDLCCIDQVGLPAYPVDCSKVAHLSVIHLGGHAHLWRWLVMANHTHTWWYNKLHLIRIIKNTAK